MTQRISRNGRITAYGLACGYTERHEVDKIAVKLWRENGPYHVACYDHRDQQMITSGFSTRSLARARKEYDKWVAWADKYANSLERTTAI